MKSYKKKIEEQLEEKTDIDTNQEKKITNIEKKINKLISLEKTIKNLDNRYNEKTSRQLPLGYNTYLSSTAYIDIYAD